MITDVIVVLDEGINLPFKIAGQVVVVEQDAVYEPNSRRSQNTGSCRVVVM